jgi:hypothetical protein
MDRAAEVFLADIDEMRHFYVDLIVDPSYMGKMLVRETRRLGSSFTCEEVNEDDVCGIAILLGFRYVPKREIVETGMA